MFVMGTKRTPKILYFQSFQHSGYRQSGDESLQDKMWKMKKIIKYKYLKSLQLQRPS